MRLLTMNLCLTLLWGTCALFPMETISTSAPVPQTGSRNSTAEPNDATAQLNTSRVPHDESQEQIATRGPTPQTAATAATAGAAEAESREANVSSAGYRSDASTAASSRSHVFTSAAGATPSHGGTTAGVAEPEPSASTGAAASLGSGSSAASSASAAASALEAASTGMTTAAAATLMTSGSSAASSASAAASSLEAASTTGPGVPQNLSSTNSSDYLTHPPPSTQSLTSPSASAGSTNTTNRTAEIPPALDPTSPPVRKPDAATARTGLPSTPRPVSDAQTPTSTSKPPDPTGPSSPSPSDSTAFSSSSAGIFIRPVSKFVPVFTTKPAPTTTAAPRASQSPSSTGVQPCSSRGLVTQCLIIIASLAGLATVFMVSTVVLCAKLSARTYKAKRPKEETEMMCISALLPERHHTYTRQHHPVSNGVLVLPMDADSDEDMGDNLTLSSFLPENERTV